MGNGKTGAVLGNIQKAASGRKQTRRVRSGDAAQELDQDAALSREQTITLVESGIGKLREPIPPERGFT